MVPKKGMCNAKAYPRNVIPLRADISYYVRISAYQVFELSWDSFIIFINYDV